MEKICLLGCESRGTIAPEIYGHFAEHIGGVYYDGLWVGEDSPVENVHGFRKFIIDKFRAIHPPVLRWPGGCFAETYNWRDGIGPREKRPKPLFSSISTSRSVQPPSGPMARSGLAPPRRAAADAAASG